MLNELNETNQRAQQTAEKTYANQCNKAQGGINQQAIGEYRPSCREEAERRIGHLRTEADKADRAIAFFRDHPEFDEFIQLIREGVIGIR